jgi:cell division protein FtsL
MTNFRNADAGELHKYGDARDSQKAADAKAELKRRKQHKLTKFQRVVGWLSLAALVVVFAIALLSTG